MTRRTGQLLGILSLLAFPCAAGAQNPQPAAPHETPPTVAPPNAPQPPPEQIAPKDNSLSDRLSRQQGMLRPPTTDPGIQAPLPPRTQGTMPVIPPPGAPGGDQKVVPK
jgi:hypothetical protein